MSISSVYSAICLACFIACAFDVARARMFRESGDRMPAVGLIDQNTSYDNQSDQVKYDLMDLPFTTDLLNTTMSNFLARKHVQISRQKPLLWIHIHKAAGTLMCKLAKIAGESVVLPNGNCNWDPADMYMSSGSPTAGPSCSTRAEYFREGHYTYGQIEREMWSSDQCWDDFDYGVMLREPIDLIHSNLNFNLVYYHGAGKGAIDQLKDRMESGLPHEARQQEWLFLDNIQIRLLTDSLGVPPGQIDESHVLAAKEILSKFKVVSVLEDLSSTRFTVFEKIGWGHDIGYHIGEKSNHASNDRFTFTSEEIEWLRDVNKHDIDLYNSFKA